MVCSTRVGPMLTTEHKPMRVDRLKYKFFVTFEGEDFTAVFSPHPR